jgi:hypothetical protein
MNIKHLKEKLEIVQYIVTIFAILIGGTWTYILFIRERQIYPHAEIEQVVSHIALSKATNLLRVVVNVKNIGGSRLIVKKSITRIQQILPEAPCIESSPCASKQIFRALEEYERKEDIFSWALIAEREKYFDDPLDLEPSEKDMKDFEFAIPSDIKAVRIYTFIRNEKRSKGDTDFGWDVSSYYDLDMSRKGVGR